MTTDLSEWVTPQQMIAALAAGHGSEFCDPVFGSARSTCYRRLAAGQLKWQAASVFQGDEQCADVPLRAWARVVKADWFTGDFILQHDGVLDRMSGIRGLRAPVIKYQLFGVKFSRSGAEAMGAKFDDTLVVQPAREREQGQSKADHGKLPPNATPSDFRDERFAHEAAHKVRDGMKLSAALREVAPVDAMREPDSVQRGIRRTYEKMYDDRGQPVHL